TPCRQGARTFFKRFGNALLAKQRQHETIHKEASATKLRSAESDTISMPIESSSTIASEQSRNMEKVDENLRPPPQEEGHKGSSHHSSRGDERLLERSTTSVSTQSRKRSGNKTAPSDVIATNNGERREYRLDDGNILTVARQNNPKSVTYHLRNHNGRSVFLEKTPTKGILMCTDENGTNRRFIAYQL
uniref:Tub domain-containing protein n=1 Tax=Ascaris lumbricoides TaxID=6252 RepID=A0A0M3I5V2_ASCLU